MEQPQHPSVEACTPHMFKPNDLNDDYAICAVCQQGWFREDSPDTWGDFTVKDEKHPGIALRLQ